MFGMKPALKRSLRLESLKNYNNSARYRHFHIQSVQALFGELGASGISSENAASLPSTESEHAPPSLRRLKTGSRRKARLRLKKSHGS